MNSINVAFTPRGAVFSESRTPATQAFLEQLIDACEATPSLHPASSSDLTANDLEAVDTSQPILKWSGIYKTIRASRAADDEDPNDRLNLSEQDWGLPAELPALAPFLSVSGDRSHADPGFEIAYTKWLLHGREVGIEPVVSGTPWIRVTGHGEALLSWENWNLLREIRIMRSRPPEERTLERNWLNWARVQSAATLAGADLDYYLAHTRVLLPQELRFDVESEMVDGELQLSIAPTFDGAPPEWLPSFDRRPVSHSYRLPIGSTWYEIIIEPTVERALREVKKLGSRRLRGRDAQQLIANPFAYFPPEISQVLDADHVEATVAALRSMMCRWEPVVTQTAPTQLGILVEPLGDEGQTTILEDLPTPAAAAAFCAVIEAAMSDRLEVCAWRGHDLEIDGYSGRSLDMVYATIEQWSVTEDSTGGENRDDVESGDTAGFDLSRYYERVEGIGIETPYAIARIPRPKELGGWLPDEVALVISPTSDPDERSELTLAQVAELEDATAAAESAQAQEVALGDGRSIPTHEAKALVETLPTDMLDAARAATGREPKERGKPKPKLSLLIKPNIDSEDFVKLREVAFTLPAGAQPRLPSTLNEGLSLKAHQEHGVAWLQHLRSYGVDHCHGALLADDMGVGKTLQLLAVMIEELETNPDLPPALVVAPVTLLENWDAEIKRFFASPPEVRLLYGTALANSKAHPLSVDPGLRATGRTMLRDNWIGNARIVLTTYETVRDYQFSLAEQQWSFVVCDEAQNMKNPNALKSRAVKKLKAHFRIAATGTPVENSLQDIWSIFDFIQPGLLPPLNQFNREYRRPIESKTEEELGALQHLRDLLHPQILRRTKQEVIKELPAKTVDAECLEIPMSAVQIRLYHEELQRLNERTYSSPQDRAIAVLNALRYFRHLCVAPGQPGEQATAELPPEEYRVISPKFGWLLDQLDVIKARDEKVIVFVEMRDVQRQLRQYLEARYGLDIHMINGETSTAIGAANSRQRLIDRFQSHAGFNIIILSPLAAGVGLNIQQANHVIHYVRHWNPAREDQATDRAYRIGQTREVFVYTPTIVGPGWSTFEQTLDRLLTLKRGMAADMLNGADDVKDDLIRELGFGDAAA